MSSLNSCYFPKTPDFCNKFITFAGMRTIIRTQEFDQFYKTLRGNVKTKIEYALNIISEIRVVNTKLAKH